MNRLVTLLCSILLSFSLQVYAADFDTELLGYQEQWAKIQYSMPEKSKQAEFEKLDKQLQALANSHPDRAEPLIWRGIVLSTWAGAKGGLGALGLVKDAKALFEKSIAMNPDALDGSAYTSLGSLYYQVPGWPIAFGDDDKARELLEKALKINPAGIDSNYFYGDYWLGKGEYEKALQYLTKAQQAEKRPLRPLADAGRQSDINTRLEMVNKKLK
jgi:tetratricopeptide (TPR) repeat protein